MKARNHLIEPGVASPHSKGVRDWFYTPDEIRERYVADERTLLAAQAAAIGLHEAVEQVVRERGSIPSIVSKQRKFVIGRQKISQPAVGADGVVLNQRAVFEHRSFDPRFGSMLYEHNRNVDLRWGIYSNQPTFLSPDSGPARKVTGAIILDSVRDTTVGDPAAQELGAMIIRTGRIFNGQHGAYNKEAGRYFDPTATFVVPTGAGNLVTAHGHKADRNSTDRFAPSHRDKPMLDSLQMNGLCAAIVELTGPDGPYEQISPAGIILPDSSGLQMQKLPNEDGRNYPQPSKMNIEWQLPLAGQLDRLP